MSLLERIYYFHDRTRHGRYPNSGDLVREFEVSPATAHRDIAYLRDRLLAPLAFSQRQNGYYYTDDGFQLPFEDTPQLILLLGLLEKIAAETGLQGLPELKKLQTKVQELIGRSKKDIRDVIHCEWIGTEPVDPKIFGAVLHGLLNCCRVDITYHSPAGKQSRRHIEPLKLVSYQGRWYILAWCRLRESRRMFHLARITAAEPTETTSENRLAADDDWLTGSFGIFKGDADARFTAQILFTGTAAEIIRRQRWHPAQHITETEQGLILHLPVADDRELLMNVLQFGSRARILQPAQLQEKIRLEIDKMACLYR